MDDGGEIEWVTPDAGDVTTAADAEAVKIVVRRTLLQDEARVLSVVASVLMAVGLVFAIGWLFLAWRVEDALATDGGSVFGGDSGDPDVVDRIIALVQISSVLLLALVTIGAGGGLRLFAGRFLSEPVDADD